MSWSSERKSERPREPRLCGGGWEQEVGSLHVPPRFSDVYRRFSQSTRLHNSASKRVSHSCFPLSFLPFTLERPANHLNDPTGLLASSVLVQLDPYSGNGSSGLQVGFYILVFKTFLWKHITHTKGHRGTLNGFLEAEHTLIASTESKKQNITSFLGIPPPPRCSLPGVNVLQCIYPVQG